MRSAIAILLLLCAGCIPRHMGGTYDPNAMAPAVTGSASFTNFPPAMARTEAAAVVVPTTRTLYAVTDLSAGATEYRVYGGSSPTGADWKLLATSPSNRIAFQTTVPGSGYVGVKAWNSLGESGWATRATP